MGEVVAKFKTQRHLKELRSPALWVETSGTGILSRATTSPIRILLNGVGNQPVGFSTVKALLNPFLISGMPAPPASHLAPYHLLLLGAEILSLLST